jgi:hypothetical protein
LPQRTIGLCTNDQFTEFRPISTLEGMPATILIRRVCPQVFIAMLLFCLRATASENNAPATDEYEIPGRVNAEDFLPRSAFRGKKIFVEKTATNDGLQNTYRIKAGTQEYEITGSTAAMEFLQELKATNQLREISTAKAFKSGLKQSAKSTYETGKKIVRDPVGAAKKVPQGASRFFGKVKGFLSQDEDESDKESSPGEAVKGLLGVDDARRKLAARLGVDVYSRNPVLQEELTRVATAMAGADWHST